MIGIERHAVFFGRKFWGQMEKRGFRDLKVYQLAYVLAMEIFEISKGFPRVERYAMTDQIHRSSRSVVANVAEGYRKRRHPNHFALKMTECDGKVAETQVWLSLASDCGYIPQTNFKA